jgi:hypothetical protein
MSGFFSSKENSDASLKQILVKSSTLMLRYFDLFVSCINVERKKPSIEDGFYFIKDCFIKIL